MWAVLALVSVAHDHRVGLFRGAAVGALNGLKFQEFVKMLKNIRPLSIFAGGVLFGTAGLKILGSRDARKAYAHVIAAGLRAKDALLTSVTSVREHVSDIYASAKDINEKREADIVVEDKAE